MRFFASMVVLGLAAGLDFGIRASASENDVWRERLEKEAPEQWAKYRARASRLQGSCVYTLTPLQPITDKRITKTYQEFKQVSDCALFQEQRIIQNGKDVGEGKLQVINSRYGFELRRSTPNSPWVISNVGTDLWKKPSVGTPLWWTESYSTWPVTLGSIHPSLSAIPITQGSVVALKQVVPILENGSQLVRAEFTYLEPKQSVVRGGWVLFDPDHYWLVRRCEARMEYARNETSMSQGSATIALEYRESADGFPILKRKFHILTIPDQNKRIEFTFDFDLREENVPESEFMLSNFGFPEPTDIKTQTPWYLWVALGGIVCLALAALFRWYARRARHLPSAH